MSHKVTWKDFQIVTETFKKVDDHEIKVDIALPKDAKPGNHPLIIAYHGGYLIGGARDYHAFIGLWVPSYAKANNAILVSPDYRLFPSCSAADIRSDLEDLWTWTQKSLPAAVSKHFAGHEVDLNRILVEGGSAGGFCAAHLAHDHGDQIKATIMVYPMVDCLSDWLQNGPPAEIAATSPLKGQDLQKKIDAANTGGWVSGRSQQEDFVFTISIMKDGKYGAMFGQDPRDNPLHRVQQEQKPLPGRVWILQGKDDTGVPAQGAIDYHKVLKEQGRAENVRLTIVDDEPSEHGFDRTWTTEDEKLAVHLRWIGEAWLGSSGGEGESRL